MDKFIYKNVETIIKRIKAKSLRPMENEVAIGLYLYNAIAGGRPLTFFNWECPPRFLDRTKNGRLFVNYLCDLDRVFTGQKIDRYTELPRVIAQKEKETALLRYLKEIGISFRFVKVIADTNLEYLTPDSKDALDERSVRQQFEDFKKRIARETYGYPVKTKTLLFSDLIRPWQALYSRSFLEVYKKLCAGNNELVKDPIVRAQCVRTRRHMGFDEKSQVLDFSRRTIASYAAEGMVFSELSKSGLLAQAVWMNIEEASPRAIAITNILRLPKGLGPMPMVFM